MKRIIRRRCTLLFVVVAFWAQAAASQPAAPALEADTAVATAGFYRLVWSGAGTGLPVYELQQSGAEDFGASTTIYTGLDQASVLSGQPDGDYFYRVRAKLRDGTTSRWSNIVMVQVSHHPLSRAFAFFAAGAVVFFATFGLIVLGNRRAEGEGEDAA